MFLSRDSLFSKLIGRIWLRIGQSLSHDGNNFQLPHKYSDGHSRMESQPACDYLAAVIYVNHVTNYLGDCRQVDLLPNFFMGRTSAVKLAGGWDSRQPYNELSEEFFIKAKRANLKVVKCNVHVSNEITLFKYLV